jgi:hypothetical protein
MSHQTSLASIIEKEVAWKGAELQRACVALVEAGLREFADGRNYFGPDNIPEEITFDGVGIVGSAVHMLREANVIYNCTWHRPEIGIEHGRRKSLRPSANGRKITLYHLTNRSLADAFMARHGKPQPAHQGELCFA